MREATSHYMLCIYLVSCSLCRKKIWTCPQFQLVLKALPGIEQLVAAAKVQVATAQNAEQAQ